MAEPRHLVKNRTCKGCGRRVALRARSDPSPDPAFLLLLALSEPHWAASEWGGSVPLGAQGLRLQSSSPLSHLEKAGAPPWAPQALTPAPDAGSEGLLTPPPSWLCWALGLPRFTLSGRSVQPEFPFDSC